MNTRSVKMAVVVSATALCGFSFAGGDWNPTGTTNTTQAIYRSGNTSTTGSVGVGMTSPGSKLQVNGNAAIGYSSGTAGPSNGLAVSGDVGVGTTTVGSKLQVNGGVAIGYSASTAAPENGLTVNGTVGIGTTNTSFCKLLVQASTSDMLAASISNFNGMAAMNVISNSNYGATMMVSNQNEGGTAASFNGNVDISGALKINNWSIEAPDYVFEKDYKLPTLNTVENHIITEKHLPGVPSAAEMKKNGVDLSQMNMTLLQKVEELTLYVIEQNKKIEALEKKVSVK